MNDVKTVRCAIYTRKSTEEGLEQEFNSLDAQREAGEAYITSQRGEGWICIEDHYDDGGFTGGNIERPAMKRLLEDIASGRIDCVVVYKVDRLSRSLFDFAQVMSLFDRHGVSFVSVTQQFNTTTSMGRLTLNILLPFAQFEREIISERTRDKIAATRRKGRWSGGRPVLGYDVDPAGGHILVNDAEAERVREIFVLYLEHQSLTKTVRALNARGWTAKQWTTRKGKETGGAPFDKNGLFKLLTNVLYLGKITYKDEIHEGAHPAIVDEVIFDRAQRLLKRNGVTGGRHVRNRFGALLKGILRCKGCNCGMVHSVTKKGTKRYRYYVCHHAQSRGWHTCASPSVPAAEIERFVVEEIRAIGRDRDILEETLGLARAERERALGELKTEQRQLGRELAKTNDQLARLATEAPTAATPDRVLGLQQQMTETEQRLSEIRASILTLNRKPIDAEEMASACTLFDPVWETLNPREQARIK